MHSYPSIALCVCVILSPMVFRRLSCCARFVIISIVCILLFVSLGKMGGLFDGCWFLDWAWNQIAYQASFCRQLHGRCLPLLWCLLIVVLVASL